jgi:hypothetical protein
MTKASKMTVSKWTTDKNEDDNNSETWVNMSDLCLGDHTGCVCVGIPSFENGMIKPNHFGILHLTREQAAELAKRLTEAWG